MEETFPATKFMSCLEKRIYDMPQPKLLQMYSEKVAFIDPTDIFLGNMSLPSIKEKEVTHPPVLLIPQK